MSTEIKFYGLTEAQEEEIREAVNEADLFLEGVEHKAGSTTFELMDTWDEYSIWNIAEMFADQFSLLTCVEDDTDINIFGPGSEPINFRLTIMNTISVLKELNEFENVEERTGFRGIGPIIERLEALPYEA